MFTRRFPLIYDCDIDLVGAVRRPIHSSTLLLDLFGGLYLELQKSKHLLIASPTTRSLPLLL
jgi:hypothetical protein